MYFIALQEQADYFVAAPEVGESGTPHIQFYIAFQKQVRFTALMKKFKRDDEGAPPWVFIKRGSCKQCSDYCKKGKGPWKRGGLNAEDPLFGLDVSPDLIEYGKLPLDQNVAGGKATEEIWARNMELALDGDFDSMTPSHQILYRKHYDEYVERKRPKPKRLTWRRGQTPNLWIYGPTGTGKSYKARELYPDLYESLKNKWWDNYPHGAPVLYEDIGEWNASKGIGDQLKVIADIYPIRVERKFGTMMIRPEVIIVTSNYSIKQLFPNPEVYEPLMDRFKMVHLTERYVHPDDVQEVIVENASNTNNSDSVLVAGSHEASASSMEWFDRFQREHLDQPPPVYPIFPVVREMAQKYPGFKVTRADDIPTGPLPKPKVINAYDMESDSEAESESYFDPEDSSLENILVNDEEEELAEMSIGEMLLRKALASNNKRRK